MTTVLVEDEPLARQELRYLLAAHPDVQVLGEAADADQARTLLTQCRPQLLLLDIALPGTTGFDLLESLDEVPPAVVFVTAYNHFATRAFDVSALDYLLKPVHPARLAQALTRARQLVGPQPTEPAARPVRLQAHSQVFLKEGDHCHFVRLADIRLLEAEGNYVRVHFGQQALLLHKSLQHMEERLPADLFFRVNRQQILNLTTIEKVHAYFKGGLLLEVQGGHRITVSTRQAVRFKETLSL
ncbi:response regulator [Hymenobacter aquaticus]|uniref:Response regulator n=1 Tax=Hymenobacter aquaticus TaxID=1867101 RepID=A0A4Z0Q8W7_9BACT|nr:response regulator [Hymenobacter aquaticus]